MSTSNLSCLCQLFSKKLNIRDVHTVKYQYFYSFRLKNVKYDFDVYFHNVFAKKFFSLSNCSGGLESLLITSPNTNTPSTLK